MPRLVVVNLRPLLPLEPLNIIPVVPPPPLVTRIQVIRLGAEPIGVVYCDDFGLRPRRFVTVLSGETGAGCDADKGVFFSTFSSLGLEIFTS